MLHYTVMSAKEVAVWDNHKHIGKILNVHGGWQYCPDASIGAGEILPSLQAVKDLLEPVRTA